MVAGFYMALGAALALTAVAGIGFILVRRLRQHLQKNLKDAITQQLGLSQRMTDIILQLQANQGKQDEQLQKIAEFSLRLKKDVAALAIQVAENEAELGPRNDERPKYLN